MALKLPDSAVPMGDFPVAKAVDIDFDDGENLQEKLDNGTLGGASTDNSTHKTTIYESHIDMGKYWLLAKITGANYSNNIIKFSCPNFKGTNDAGFKYEDDMDIYKFELHFNTGSRRENNGYGVTLKQHGLGLYSYPLNNPKNTEPKIEEAVRLYWDYSKGDIYVFLVDMMTAIPHCVLEYTGSGTLLKENTFVMDDLYNRRDGLNGTWEKSKWKSIPYNKLEIPPIYELGGNGGSTEGAKTAIFNSKTFKIDITKGSASWNGNLKFGYVVDNSYGEIIISSLGVRDVTWSCSDGVNFVKSVTYTIDSNNQAHVTIGVELYDIVYGVHQLEMAGDFATINSFTADAFTGTSVAGRGTARGRNNGVGILCNVADLGLTTPCTTIQIAQAIRNLTNAGNRIPRNGIIGMFDNEGNTITDAPSQYGLLQINAYGYDRIMIRYEGIGSSSYTGSWIGQIKGSSGVFSSITWSRIDLETRVNELFQSVSDGKTLVANAITGKGVSTATDATFATMATNISKISAYKEETKSLIVTSNSTGTEPLKFTFSANVIAVKRIVAPSDSCRIVPQTSKDMFTIAGKELIVHVTGSGTWKATALIEK